MTIEHAIEMVEWYIEEEGYTLQSSNTWSVDRIDRIVYYPANSKGKVKLISLLHELGHIVQPESRFAKGRSSSFNKALILEQEYSAWIEGQRIAEELTLIPICITNKEYTEHFARYWSSYIEAVAFSDVSGLKETARIYRSN
ncbi:MAG: hypothetical protein ACO3UU_05975 [Minisyncoccia bacterium]|jgi:hypothetical protein